MMPGYPTSPGSKTGTGPSQEAASAVAPRARALWSRVFDHIVASGFDGATADECAEALGVGVLSVRPRLSELHTQLQIVDSGRRRPNASGHSAVVWRLRMPEDNSRKDHRCPWCGEIPPDDKYWCNSQHKLLFNNTAGAYMRNRVINGYVKPGALKRWKETKGASKA